MDLMILDSERLRDGLRSAGVRLRKEDPESVAGWDLHELEMELRQECDRLLQYPSTQTMNRLRNGPNTTSLIDDKRTGFNY
jgi:hypothetical protein